MWSTQRPDPFESQKDDRNLPLASANLNSPVNLDGDDATITLIIPNLFWAEGWREKGVVRETIYAEARATPARIQFTKFPAVATKPCDRHAAKPAIRSAPKTRWSPRDKLPRPNSETFNWETLSGARERAPTSHPRFSTKRPTFSLRSSPSINSVADCDKGLAETVFGIGTFRSRQISVKCLRGTDIFF